MPSHGSLSKAGRVRGQNPLKFDEHLKTKKGLPKWNKRKSKSPKISNRGSYKKLMINGVMKDRGNRY